MHGKTSKKPMGGARDERIAGAGRRDVIIFRRKNQA